MAVKKNNKEINLSFHSQTTLHGENFTTPQELGGFTRRWGRNDNPSTQSSPSS